MLKKKKLGNIHCALSFRNLGNIENEMVQDQEIWGIQQEAEGFQLSLGGQDSAQDVPHPCPSGQQSCCQGWVHVHDHKYQKIWNRLASFEWNWSPGKYTVKIHSKLP